MQLRERRRDDNSQRSCISPLTWEGTACGSCSRATITSGEARPFAGKLQRTAGRAKQLLTTPPIRLSRGNHLPKPMGHSLYRCGWPPPCGQMDEVSHRLRRLLLLICRPRAFRRTHGRGSERGTPETYDSVFWHPPETARKSRLRVYQCHRDGTPEEIRNTASSDFPRPPRGHQNE